MVAVSIQHRQKAIPYKEPTASVNHGLNIKGKGWKDQSCEARKEHSHK